MANPHQLVFYLLAFGLQLHFVGQRLPAAASTDAEMLAEGLQAVGGGLHNAFDEAFHIVFLFLVYLDVHDVSGNGEVYEHNHAVYVRERFALGCNGFNLNVLKEEVDFLLSGHRGKLTHAQVNII